MWCSSLGLFSFWSRVSMAEQSDINQFMEKVCSWTPPYLFHHAHSWLGRSSAVLFYGASWASDLLHDFQNLNSQKDSATSSAHQRSWSPKSHLHLSQATTDRVWAGGHGPSVVHTWCWKYGTLPNLYWNSVHPLLLLGTYIYGLPLHLNDGEQPISISSKSIGLAMPVV